ncbi:MAG: VCBS repeat-containing protein [Deltaproteobacteria bacterium]|nr:VCBS repeat-containing protein [Deltaproteobacteria bacterium]
MKRSHICIIHLLTGLFYLSAAGLSFARESKIVIFPFDATAGEDVSDVRDALPVLMPSRLSVPGRLSAHTLESLQPGAAQKSRMLSQKEKLSVAKRLGADYCLTGSITRISESLSIDVLLTDMGREDSQTPLYIQIPGKDATIPQVTSLCAQVKQAVFEKDEPAAAAAPPPADEEPEESPPPAPKQKTPASGQPATVLLPPPAAAAPGEHEDDAAQKPAQYLSVPRQPELRSGNPVFEAHAAASYMIKSSALTMLCTGDVNGDGRKELLMGGPEALFVYTIGSGMALAPAENISIGKAERLVHIDTGDFNGNGTDEIYVSSYDGTEANSFVIEYRNGSYQRLAEKLPWFFRAYARSGGAAALLGQAATVGNPFAGDIVSLGWNGAALTAGKKIKLPVICGIYSFAEADIDNDSRSEFFVFQRGIFDATLKLSILSPDGKTLWKDTHDLGATSLFFKRSVSMSESQLKEPIPMRIILGSADSGQPFMIAGKNAQKGDSFFNFLIKNTQGAATCLAWNGSAFEYNWASDFVKDFIADYILDDTDGDGKPELFVLGVTGEVTGSFALNRLQVFRER